LWSLPQSVAWERLHLVRVVARYAAKLVMAERGDASAAILAEVRQLEDRLGLSAMSMLRLRWVIADDKTTDQSADVANLNDYRDAL